MAWNKPIDKKVESGKKVERRGGGGERNLSSSSFNYKALIAGLVVVLVGGLVVWLFSGGEKRPTRATKETSAPTQIAEQRPAPAPKVDQEESAAPHEKTEAEIRAEKIAFYERAYGADMPPAIKAVVYYLKNPPKQEYKVRVPYDFMRHPCEQQVASLMSVEPGTYFVINPNYGKEFDDDFTKAFVDGTTVNADDSEEVRLIKENVSKTMQDLARICREEGKKPSEVMTEYADSMYSLGQFQRNLEQELQKIYDAPELSDEEVKDFVAAANQMLEEKGIAPLPYPDLTERSIELQYNQHALERNEGEE